MLKEKVPSLIVGNAGSSVEIMAFSFEHVPAKELAGVVLSVNGKLYVREIKAS
jgi:hypothetical protein